MKEYPIPSKAIMNGEFTFLNIVHIVNGIINHPIVITGVNIMLKLVSTKLSNNTCSKIIIDVLNVITL